jgi:hypothetical protein
VGARPRGHVERDAEQTSFRWCRVGYPACREDSRCGPLQYTSKSRGSHTTTRAAEDELLYYSGNTLHHRMWVWRKAVFRRYSEVRRRGGGFHGGGAERNVYLAIIVTCKFGFCDTGVGGGSESDEPQTGTRHMDGSWWERSGRRRGFGDCQDSRPHRAGEESSVAHAKDASRQRLRRPRCGHATLQAGMAILCARGGRGKRGQAGRRRSIGLARLVFGSSAGGR